MLKDWGERKVHYSVSVKKGKEGKRNNLIVEFFLLLFVRVRSFCEGFKNVIFHRCWSAAEQGGVVKNGNLCQVFWSDGSNWVKNRNSVARIVCVCTCVRRVVWWPQWLTRRRRGIDCVARITTIWSSRRRESGREGGRRPPSGNSTVSVLFLGVSVGQVSQFQNHTPRSSSRESYQEEPPRCETEKSRRSRFS